MWSDKDGDGQVKEHDVKGNLAYALVNKFVPYTKNYARIRVYNGRYA